MNFLAHLYLTREGAASWVGSILPDIVRGRLSDPMSQEMIDAVALHRLVDGFTDRHPMFDRRVDVLRPHAGRFSGIVIDVWYDHLLAVDWAKWHDEPVESFIDHVYEVIRAEPEVVPPSARAVMSRVVDDDWLRCYTTVEGVGKTLSRMSHRISTRFKRDVDLLPALHPLHEHFDDVQEHFRAFFPEVVAFVAGHPAARAQWADAK